MRVEKIQTRRFSGNTASLDQFLQTIGRSLALVELSFAIQLETLRRTDGKPLAIDASDLLRAAVVLAVSAMDAYFTDRFVEMLVPFLKKREPGKDLISLLERAGLSTEQLLRMLRMERPYQSLRSLVDHHLETYTTQSFKLIDNLYLVYGLKDFSRCIEKKLGRKTIRRSIEILVQRRHRIVHAGDANSHRRIAPIDGGETLRRITDMRNFVLGAEALLNRIIKLDKPPKRVWETVFRETLRRELAKESEIDVG